MKRKVKIISFPWWFWGR